MNEEGPSRLRLSFDNQLARRSFLQYAAIAASALWASGFAEAATTELWEEGDPLCAVPYKPLNAPAGYALDNQLLETFTSLSKALTGVSSLDAHLANEYLERYATHPQLTRNLGLLVDAYKALPGNPPAQESVTQLITSSDPKVRFGAKQLIYLWYLSAFFIPLDPNPNPASPAIDDTDNRKRIWVYGSPEQYRDGLLWNVIQAHAPMTPGGPRNHWAHTPSV